jgi:large subunit ribosomal protein L21
MPMYAIVKAGGRQYRVEEGDTLLVGRMRVEEGETIELEPVLLRGEEPVMDPDGLARGRVAAVVRGHERGEKVHVLKFKPKRGYKRRMGHRSELTRLEVSEISLGSGGARASAGRSGRARAGREATGASEPGAGAGSSQAAREGGNGA